MDTITYQFEYSGSGESDGSSLTPEQETQVQGTPSATNPTMSQGNFRTSLAVTIGFDAAKQLGSAMMSNVGTFTGSALMQDRINTASKFVGYGLRIVADPTPFKVASIASIGIEMGVQVATYAFDRKIRETQMQRDLMRLGLGSYRNL